MSFLRKSACLLFATSLFSCSNEDEISKSVVNYEGADKVALMKSFAKSLSAVVEESQEARALLKSEALKEFDKNYDVLWEELKNKSVGDISFREYVEMKSSPELLDSIENVIPKLNILFPEIPLVDVSPESYNPAQSDLPVVVPTKNANLLFFDGEFADSVDRGLFPSSHVLVVNENIRVEVDATPVTRGSSRSWHFTNEAYNGQKSETRSFAVKSSEAKEKIGSKAISAFSYFNKDDESDYSTSLQRDYIYYGMTPDKQTGKLNNNIKEYLTSIRVDPKAYFTIADDKNDPTLKTQFLTGTTSTLKESDSWWTQGCFNFHFQIVRESGVVDKYIPAKARDIWGVIAFNITYKITRNRNSQVQWFYICPDYIYSKTYYLENKIDLDKWRINEEALQRFVHVYEDDEEVSETETQNYEFTKLSTSKFNGEFKIGLGIKSADLNLSGGVSSEHSNSTTEKRTISYSRTTKKGADNLGSAVIYYYDPIIIERYPSGSYIVNTYNTGIVEFSIVPALISEMSNDHN